MSTAVLPNRQTAGQRQSSLAVSASKTELLKRGAIALSIANLCFLFVWSEILRVASDQRVSYFLQRRPDRQFLWALLLDITLLGAFIFCLLWLRKSGMRPWRDLATGVVGVICLFALYQLHHSTNASLSEALDTRMIWTLRISAAGLIAFFAIRFSKRVLPALRMFFLILAPLFAIFTAQGLWLYYGADPGRFAPGQAAGLLPAAVSQNRVIWIIFDELDSRFSFEARPGRIQLPNFDALRSGSIFSGQVRSPAYDTLSALPSLVLSKTIPNDANVRLDVRPVQVRFSGCSQWAGMTSQENVFRRARALGFNTAVSGWYHPYCRLFGSDLSACATTPDAQTWLSIFQGLLRDRPFLEKAAYLANWQARTLPLVRRFRLLSPMPEEYPYLRQVLIGKLNSVLESGMPMLKDSRLNLLLLHIPCPHPPGIWDTHKHAFTIDGRPDYLDNLVLADSILGNIRQTLEQSGDWDRSTILVSADHPYRPADWLVLNDLPPSPEMVRLTRLQWQPYVPFFLKLPGQKTGLAYTREFNNVLSADLLLQALQGNVRTPEQAVQWLDAHAAASEEKVCR